MKRALLILSLLVLAGCDKKPDDPAGSGPTSPDNKTDNKVELKDDDIPVKADFTEEAETSINKDNYKGELDKLAAEIDKD